MARMSGTFLALIALIAFWSEDQPPVAARPDNKTEARSKLVWKKATASPFARVESPTAVIDGKMYLFGGFTDDLGASKRLDVYDPASDSWTRKKDLPVGLTHLNPANAGKAVWFAGGFKGKHPGPVSAEVWKYDIASDRWTSGPPLPERRAGGGLVALAGRLHYFGGYKADRDTNAKDHWSLSLDGAKNGDARPTCPIRAATSARSFWMAKSMRWEAITATTSLRSTWRRVTDTIRPRRNGARSPSSPTDAAILNRAQ